MKKEISGLWGGLQGGDQTSDRRPFPRGAIRYQTGKSDYLQKPLPTGQVNAARRLHRLGSRPFFTVGRLIIHLPQLCAPRCFRFAHRDQIGIGYAFGAAVRFTATETRRQRSSADTRQVASSR